jgi:outer membrane protein
VLLNVAARYCRVMMAYALLGATPTARALNVPDLADDPLSTLSNHGPQPDSLADDAGGVCPPQVDLAQPLALVDAVDLALCHNPQAKAAWASIKIQAATLGEARAAFLPTLTGAMSRLNTRTRYPASPMANTVATGNTANAALNWRLIDFGGRTANLEAAERTLQAALAGRDATLQKLLASVVGAYFDVLTTRAALAARHDARTLAERSLDATQRRERKGVAARSDVLQAGVALAKAQLAEQRATGDYQKAVSVLIYSMGLPSSTAIHLAEPPEVRSTEAVRDLDAWLADASEHHPAILAARAQRDAAKAKVVTARSEGLPSIDLVSNYYQNGYPNQGLQQNQMKSTSVGLTLTIPFFEGFARTYKIRQAEGQAEQSVAQMEDTENQVLSDIVKAYADAKSSLANLASSATLLEAAEGSVASSEKRYAGGAADVLELLAAQSALADAQQERVRCLAEWRSAQLRLMANAGVLGRDAISR